MNQAEWRTAGRRAREDRGRQSSVSIKDQQRPVGLELRKRVVTGSQGPSLSEILGQARSSRFIPSARGCL